MSTGLLLHLVTLNDKHTHTLDRTPLDEGSARQRDHREFNIVTTHGHTRYDRTDLNSDNILRIQFYVFSMYTIITYSLKMFWCEPKHVVVIGF